MPQQELWAASARATGFTFSYTTPDRNLDDDGLVVIRPTWSKTPSGRDGHTTLKVPSYAVWALPEVFAAGFQQYLGGDPRFAGSTARVVLRTVLDEFADGRRS